MISSTELILDAINEQVNLRDYAIVTKLKNGDLELVKLIVPEKATCNGKRLVDLGLPRSSIVVAVDRTGDDMVIPNGDTQIRAGDQVIVMVRKENLDDVRSSFAGVK